MGAGKIYPSGTEYQPWLPLNYLETRCELNWETALRGKGAEESWQLFKDLFMLLKHELLILMFNKSDPEGRRPA